MLSNRTKTGMNVAADAAARAAGSAVQDGAEAVHTLAEQASDRVQEGARALKSSMADGVGDLRDTLEDNAEDARDSLVTEGLRLARRLRSAASDQAGSVQSRVMEVVAGGIERVSDRAGSARVSTLLSDSKAFARRNPVAVVAGAAVIGFALARMIGASARRDAAERRRF